MFAGYPLHDRLWITRWVDWKTFLPRYPFRRPGIRPTDISEYHLQRWFQNEDYAILEANVIPFVWDDESFRAFTQQTLIDRKAIADYIVRHRIHPKDYLPFRDVFRHDQGSLAPQYDDHNGGTLPPVVAYTDISQDISPEISQDISTVESPDEPPPAETTSTSLDDSLFTDLLRQLRSAYDHDDTDESASLLDTMFTILERVYGETVVLTEKEQV